ncbi:SA1362 family protein [Virgibacillus halodenitrificans]|uniref:Uncharacterized protein n=1 Tax=Virgibacillus halodenitrificans TaxID=1482 RepID=A0ABR7VLC7_VIRHA|nr:SA1362 family protein [Virgibacillus halodenitrificans]MBD1222729.1 hypothetical protein [Virgibacillus halodenitrificans]MYL47196.1 hypothetical protein [Virgibacillus halodenitrificans]WHX27488.1 SA1362 family protein [Virgibacillus halodenitrificans]
MARNKISIIMYLIISLAAVGLVSQIFTNTKGFLTNILVMLGFGIAMFAVIYFIFLKKKAPSNDMKKYKKAVKQSKAKYKHNTPVKSTHTKKQVLNPSKRKPNKRASHLKVIDGNKSKEKDRASF